jgi:DNA mismatch endonuclease (patch repair protein)
MAEHRGTPPPSSDHVRQRMRVTKQRDTPAEVALRKELHRRGFRYTIDAVLLDGLRRRGDIVFRRARVAVFVDGCFWHGCPRHGTWPKAHAAWWRQKILENRRRDLDTDRRLRRSGWCVLRLWSHDPPARAADRIAAIVRQRVRI